VIDRERGIARERRRGRGREREEGRKGTRNGGSGTGGGREWDGRELVREMGRVWWGRKGVSGGGRGSLYI